MNDAREFASRLLDLLRNERAAMAEFLVALADFDDRRLWIKLGHTSLFTFLHRDLGLSKGASHFRKVAAELIQRYPEVVAPLRDGRLCITSVVELARVITQSNLAEVLPRFFHTSKQEAKAVAAEISPAEGLPRRSVVTALPLQAARPRLEAPPEKARAVQPGELERWQAPTSQPADSLLRQGDAEVRPVELEPTAMPAPQPRTLVAPLTAEARRLHVTVSKRFLEKLAAARDALSHSHPGADAETILEAGLDLLIERAAKRKGIVTRPRATVAPRRLSGPRSIPASVKREVWLRDEGRCRWPTADGCVCGSTRRLQFDHLVPVSRGGESTTDNLRLLCGAHNDLAARQVLGDALMDRYSRGLGAGRASAGDLGCAHLRGG